MDAGYHIVEQVLEDFLHFYQPMCISSCSNYPNAHAFPWKVPGKVAPVVMSSDGSILFKPDVHYKTLCGDIQEPWKVETCKLEFGSSTYGVWKIDIMHKGARTYTELKTSSYKEDPKFEV